MAPVLENRLLSRLGSVFWRCSGHPTASNVFSDGHFEKRIVNTACLILKASEDACGSEIAALEANLKATDSKVVIRQIDWVSQDDFIAKVGDNKFKIIYVGAHADGKGFGDNNKGVWHDWQTLALSICISDCMVPEGVLFMGCCRGGMKTIALQIFKVCNRIDYIVGPNQKAKGGDLVAAFTAFVRDLKNGAAPIEATERATGATGDQYTCHDRQELDVELTLSEQLDRIEGWAKSLTEILARSTITIAEWPREAKQTPNPVTQAAPK